MANEISASAGLSMSKGGVTFSQSVALTVQATKDMTGAQGMQSVQIVGTSTEAIALGDVSTIGYVLLKNLDETNYVEIALATPATTQIFCKLRAGDIAIFPAATATMYAIANTAPINLLVLAIEL